MADRRGRPSKGERAQKTMRFPLDHYAHYQAAASRAGMDFNAYVNWVLARGHELDPPDGEPAGGDQLQLGADAAGKPRLEGAA